MVSSFELPHLKLITVNKSTFFNGQPIFTQLLKFIPKDSVTRIAHEHKADYYSKRFNTYEHLVTMLYSIFNNCNSLREVSTGMLASEERLTHLGIRYHPRRSTISDANNRRMAEVFGQIYYTLYKKYAAFLSDSRKSSKASKLYIFLVPPLFPYFRKCCVHRVKIHLAKGKVALKYIPLFAAIRMFR